MPCRGADADGRLDFCTIIPMLWNPSPAGNRDRREDPIRVIEPRIRSETNVAHSLSAKKRIRQTLKRRARNRARKDSVKQQVKSLLGAISVNGDGAGESDDLDPAERRDLIRKAIIGILAGLDPADPTARTYRRKLSAAL